MEQGFALKGKVFSTEQMSYSTPVGLFVMPILMRLKSSVHSLELIFYLLMFPLSCIICAYMLYYNNLARQDWWDLRVIWMTNHPPSVPRHCWLGHHTEKLSDTTYSVSSGPLVLRFCNVFVTGWNGEAVVTCINAQWYIFTWHFCSMWYMNMLCC